MNPRIPWLFLMITLLVPCGCRMPADEALANLRGAQESLAQGGEIAPATGEDPAAVWLESMAVLIDRPPAAARGELIEILLAGARAHPSPAVRAGSLRALPVLVGEEPPPAGMRDVLMAALADTSIPVRVAAAEVALPLAGFAIRPEYRALLLPAASGPEKLAALTALSGYAIGLGDDNALVARVVACADDPDPGVSYHARVVLARMTGRDGADPGQAREWTEWWRRRMLQQAGHPPAGKDGS